MELCLEDDEVELVADAEVYVRTVTTVTAAMVAYCVTVMMGINYIHAMIIAI